MFPGFGGGVPLKVDKALEETVEKAAENSVRCVQVVVKDETLVSASTVPETGSLEEDFKAVAAILEDDAPCICLVRLKGSERFADTDWALVVYTPDGAPVKKRMMNASSVKPLQAALKHLTLVDYQTSDKSEVNLKEFNAATKTMTEAERLACMTQEERDLAGVKKAVAKEQAAAPKKMAGMVALNIKALDSFKDAVKTLVDEKDKAVVAKLTGDKSEEVDGEVLSNIAKVSDLQGGKLPAEVPCYVLFRPAVEDGKAKRLLVVTWLPEYSAVKLRMKLSTFKASLLEQVKELAPDVENIIQSEVTCDEDLTDDLAAEKKSVSTTGGGYNASAVPKPSAVPKFGLPGMMGGKPPPGAVKMPGM